MNDLQLIQRLQTLHNLNTSGFNGCASEGIAELISDIRKDSLANELKQATGTSVLTPKMRMK